ncbi:hypothetical protein [Nakamurella aerolata]|uniref:Uncharacterized protein n=1 Tax=Nakamurella aerolata TaxID=1656892 RepID=A0A849A8F8_9ACTN|nr:hypothetical protein [Nakamurella aerolata]NNG36795.1 hypothetical protein [Nakamurella aerolata]
MTQPATGPDKQPRQPDPSSDAETSADPAAGQPAEPTEPTEPTGPTGQNETSGSPDPAATVEPTGEALVLTTVAVPYGNRLTSYDAAGTGVIWIVPPELSARVAAGTLPRREAGEGTTAECVVVDEKRMVLKGIDDDEWPVAMFDESSLPVPMPEFRERLRQLLVQAARRGESVIFARPGLMELEPPCVRASVLQDEDGTWLSVVESFPPIDNDAWADAEADEESAIKSAPANEADMMGAVMLMLMAAQHFAPGPEQIGLFFEDAPDGAWPADQ